jgi:hypothetical protein
MASVQMSRTSTEVIINNAPSVQVSRASAEVITQNTPNVSTARMSVEVIISLRTPFRGWEVPV